MEATDLMIPAMQYGFAGFAMVLLAIIVWLIRQLLAVLRETNAIIDRNTMAIEKVRTTSDDSIDLLRQTHDHLLKRPCIAKGD